MTTKTHRSSASLALTATVCAALSALSAAGCAEAVPQPIREAPVVAIPPASVAPPPGSSAPLPPILPPPPPSAPAPAPPPSAAPAPAASVDRKNCHPQPPAVTFEVKDDDAVISLDAAGCPLGEAHFKSNGYSYKASVDVMTELQRLLKAGDRNGLADLTNYPLRVNFDKRPLIVKDRAAFLRDFDRIYSPAVNAVILAQDPRSLFCRDQGVMLGRGILWVDSGRKEDHLGVTAINPP